MRISIRTISIIAALGASLVTTPATADEFSLAGSWEAVEFGGDQRVNTENTKLQVIFYDNKRFEMVGYTKAKGKNRGVQHIKGDRVGRFMLTETGEAAEIRIDKNDLILTDPRNGKWIRLRRSGLGNAMGETFDD